MRHIYKKFNLQNKNYNGGDCDVVGISTLNGNTKITANDVRFSRGEFAGYFIENGQIHLFRDRLGARNIYHGYNTNTKEVLVSTDMLWMLENSDLKMINKDYRLEYLQYQVPVSLDWSTMFCGIYKVPAATIININTHESEVYWRINFGTAKFKPDVLRELIVNAVNFRKALVKDKKVTAYLSGGLDSSAMTILSGVNMAYSGFYEDKECSELEYIKEVAKACNLVMDANVEIKEKKFYEYLDKLFYHLPSPCCGLGIIAQMIVADSAKEYDYAFTGEGGDEIFLGYNWNTIIIEMVKALNKLKRDIYMVGYEKMINDAINNGFKGWTEGILNRAAIGFKFNKELPWNENLSVINNIHYINLKIGLPAILTVDEAVGYYSGVEPISPLIDHEIVDYVCSINEAERSLLPKHLFREAMIGILPERIRVRTNKMGFPIPVRKWKWPMLKDKIKYVKDNIDGFENLHIGGDSPVKMNRWAWALFNLSNIYGRINENAVNNL